METGIAAGVQRRSLLAAQFISYLQRKQHFKTTLRNNSSRSILQRKGVFFFIYI